MAYLLIGEAAMVVHFLFLVFMAVGGFLAWRWPRLIGAHLAVAAWGVFSVTTGAECPLTVVEDWGRRKAGERGLVPGGFIDHYIEGVVYPERHADLARLAVAVLVAVSWAGCLLLARRRRARTGRPGHGGAGSPPPVARG
ncbi:DUF2784 domain-containing protein [Planomonospora parontospora]|uniref:DUF2784 domain-containing protein n=1 Tax=Planomonospora parontospora TaxID=58119 RepID=UPI001670B2C1|nr:DUF2784 domain-containing protein [Planomonospora parontospora]GGL19887.1 hypothetical protein GCM10014719_22520 [Planomonospora parontospora subsp. antibiotica]GII13674.1 hypothetical protein Ppa05_04000 [Planomonospora parontospora subsp. antibiotica]